MKVTQPRTIMFWAYYIEKEVINCLDLCGIEFRFRRFVQMHMADK